MQLSPRLTPPDRHFAAYLPGDFAAVTCYFNPCDYGALKRNYAAFAADLKRQGVALYAIELAYDDRPFFLDDDGYTVQLRAIDVLWQKERLLNLLISRLPSSIDKVAWIDADVIFANRNWVRDTQRLLERFPVVQLFETAIHLARDGTPYASRTGVAALAAKSNDAARDFGQAHPGFAWAARRSLLSRFGLLQDVIVGDCDGLMVQAMYGWWDHWLISHFNEPMEVSFLSWARPFHNEVQGQVGFVRGNLLHLWHGRLANRGYLDRIAPMNDNQFDPNSDIEVGPDGLWRWSSNKPALHAAVKEYFFARKDDE